MTLGADPLEHTAPYRVRFDEAGPDGRLRTSGLLRYAQDVAWQHSEVRGLTRAWYAERGLAWVVRAAELRVAEPIPMGARVDLTTRVVGYQRIWAQRHAECRLPGGTVAARVRTDWVMIDGRGRLARVPPEIPATFPAPLLTDPILRVALAPAPVHVAGRQFAVRPHELDPMNHPNNAVYVDWLEECLLAAGHDAAALVGALPTTIRLEYAAAPEPGALIAASLWPTAVGWAGRFSSENGTDFLRAQIDP